MSLSSAWGVMTSTTNPLLKSSAHSQNSASTWNFEVWRSASVPCICTKPNARHGQKLTRLASK